MCRGCKVRERLMRRTHQSLEAAVDALGDAFARGVPNAFLRDGGMARFRAIVVDCAFVTLEPRRPSEKTMRFSDKPRGPAARQPTRTKQKTPARRAAGAPTQLALAF